MKTKTFFADLRSGTVVFLVAMPLCLGIALACGMPLISGIITGVIGGIVVTLLSDSTYSVSGPAAGLTAIIISSVAELGSLEAFSAAIVAAGVLQALLGVLKAGGVGNYIPNAVIKGMLAGIGIILIIKQIPHLVGYDADPEGDMEFLQPDGHNSLSDLFYMINYITPGSLVIGLVSFVILALAEKKTKNNIFGQIPGPLYAVAGGILMNIAFSYSPFLRIGREHCVDLPVIGGWNDLHSNLTRPAWSAVATARFWIIAGTLAAVASIETLLNIEAIVKLDPEKQKVNANRELLAQGAGNILSGLAGGLPLTSVIVRSSANISAGAKTRLSVVIHALLLLVSVLLFPRLLMLIPNSCLAVILITTGYKLCKPSLFKAQYGSGFDQFLPFIVTVVVMLVTDLLKGVGAGFCVAVFFIIRDNVTSSFDTHREITAGRLRYLIRLPQHLTFFNKSYIIRFFADVKPGSKVVIDGSINKTTSKDTRDAMRDFLAAASERNIEIEFINYNIDN